MTIDKLQLGLDIQNQISTLKDMRHQVQAYGLYYCQGVSHNMSTKALPTNLYIVDECRQLIVKGIDEKINELRWKFEEL